MDIVKDYYSIAEVAERLGVSIKTVRRHIAAGSLGSVRAGNAYRVPKDALLRFLDAGPKLNEGGGGRRMFVKEAFGPTVRYGSTFRRNGMFRRSET